MRVVYLPIDERPCNTQFVEMIAQSSSNIELLTPPKEDFGYKKKPANTENVWTWLISHAPKADAIILNIDMLIYGGLIPSRIHHLPEEICEVWKTRLRMLHDSHPNIPIYAANVIMRTPRYSSDDEEPDYYGHLGKEIFLRGYYLDKKCRESLTDEEEKQLNDLEKKIPKEYIEDYENRRKFNLNINTMMIELVHEGVIHFLVFPQDDSAEYGYTAKDQQIVLKKRESFRLYKKIHMYPGSDEVGATLLARVFNEYYGIRPKIYPIWSSTLGSEIIPMYEDRPFLESLKAHVLAAGCGLTDNPDKADLILAYNTPGRVMQESWDQKNKDVTYSSFRNLLTFVDQIKSFIISGKKVIVADSAYANGGDLELICLLDDEEILDRLISYKGWNTNCNTLGTTISQGAIGLNGDPFKLKYNLIYHLIDDYFYQAEVRMEMVKDFLPKYGLNYFDLKKKAELVNKERDKRLRSRFNEVIKNSFQDMKIEELLSFAPWNRMFEIGLKLKISKGRSFS